MSVDPHRPPAPYDGYQPVSPPAGGQRPPGGMPQPPAAPYLPPQDPRYAAAIQPRQEPQASTLGIVAVVLALVALVVPPIVLGMSAYAAADALAAADLQLQGDELLEADAYVLAALSPARGAVLAGEIAFWAGTAVGIWALVQGIVAIAKRRGRGPGIAAVVIAAIAPVAVVIAVLAGLAAGAVAGAAGSAL